MATVDYKMQGGIKTSDELLSVFPSESKGKGATSITTTKKQLERSFKAPKSLSRKVKKKTISTKTACIEIAKKVVSKNISSVNKRSTISSRSTSKGNDSSYSRIHGSGGAELEDCEIITCEAETESPARSDGQPLEEQYPEEDSFDDNESITQEHMMLTSQLNEDEDDFSTPAIENITGHLVSTGVGSKELWFLDTKTKVIFHFIQDNKWTLEILENVKPPKTKTIVYAPRRPSIRLQNFSGKSIKFVKKVVLSNLPKQSQIKPQGELNNEAEGLITANEELFLSDEEGGKEEEQHGPLPQLPPLQSTVSVSNEPLRKEDTSNDNIITEQTVAMMLIKIVIMMFIRDVALLIKSRIYI